MTNIIILYSLVCGIQHVKTNDQDWLLTGVIPVSGDIGSRRSKPNVTRTDTGLRAEMPGGSWGDFTPLAAVLDLVCDPDIDSQLEFVDWDLHTLKLKWSTKQACADETSEPKKPEPDQPEKSKDPKEPDTPETPENPDKPVETQKSWGFFTWLFFLLVLGIAGYIILQAWANYNRYGTLNVDSNSEFLKEIPFLLRDFFRKVVGTFSGGNNRGYTSV